MKHFSTRIWGLLLVSLVLFSMNAVSAAKQKRPRFAPPSQYGSGYVNVVEYLMMDDPRQAAEILLKEAAMAHVDVDRPGASEPHDEIRLPSGTFVPREDDDRFMRWVNAEIAAGRADEDTVCLVKMRRVPSIRELADIMKSGVRVYKDIQYYTYISRVPLAVAQMLRNNPLVEWIGFFSSDSKVLAGSSLVEGLPVTVHSLVQDSDELRSDLSRAGAKVDRYRESIGRGATDFEYTITIDPSRINQVTSLWWVYLVYQDQGVFHGGLRDSRALGITRFTLLRSLVHWVGTRIPFRAGLICVLEHGRARAFHKFIIITMILLFTHDSAIRWEEVQGALQEGPCSKIYTRS
ncbi:MAG TPA: hypothetical protein VFH88_02360 [Candidatus Krumholzibacteria bacterium]|nr:hypothetical protein [Candidatus Krumholzibacteria bacterium]